VVAATDVGVLSPVVRRLASEHGIDLSRVTGTGRGGRITRRDVEAFVAAGAPAATAPVTEERRGGLGRGITDLLADAAAPPAGVVNATAAPAVEPAPAAEPVSVEEPVPVEEIVPASAPAVIAGSAALEEPLPRMRTRIATNMIKAKQSAAHVWTSMEVDFEAVERVRRRHRPAFKEREGFSLTYLPFIARATIDALAAFPVVNSSFDLEGGTRTLYGNVDLGIGVDLDQEGLVVMTMRGADGLRLRGLAREVRRLAGKARGGDMEPDDLSGSTFTITNPGPYGSFMSAPIINVPNVAILSTDGIKKRPVVLTDAEGNDAIAIRHVGYLGLTWDHRAFDGSTAVLFLRRIKENLEHWDWEQELA
jgi:2-oxoglutarate dehydrogenase E2 component (dihydrolipoamide succinyltransferase)